MVGRTPTAFVVVMSLVSLVALGPPGSAYAADADEKSTDAAQPASELNEVIVTARRRDENIEKVPISITALGTAQLEERQVRTEADLQLSIPGLTVRETTNQNTLNYSIRGQSIDAFSASSPAVLVYYDEIEASSTISTNFFDLDSVQVLKGPQGTLFGRNSTGGAVLFSTAKPGNDFSGYALARYGNDDLREFQGATNLPLIPDKVLLRVAADFVESDGYIHDLYHGTYLGGQDQKSARVSLTLKPIEELANTTVAQWSQLGGTNVSGSLYSVNACGSTNHGIPLADTVGCLYNPAFPGFAAYLAAHPQAYPGGILAYAALQDARGPFTVENNSAGDNAAHSGFVSNTTRLTLGEDMELKNIIGYSDEITHENYDIDGSPYTVFYYTQTPGRRTGDLTDNRTVSEELQLQGKTLNKALTYIVGGYYSHDRSETDFPLSAIDLSPVIPPTSFEYHWRTFDLSRALFAQGTYDLSALLPNLSFTGGVRYTWEHIDLAQLANSSFYGAASEDLGLKHPSWTAGVEYQIEPELLLYVSTRGSWRTGGFNGAVTPLPTTADKSGNLFESETTEDVEIGSKYSGRLLGQPLRLNLAVYNQWVHNVQRTLYVVINGSTPSITGNIPEARITGIELDGDVTPLEWLTLGVAFAFTDARYTSPSVSLFGTTLTYGPYADTPRESGSAYALFELPVQKALGSMSVRAEVYAQARQYFSNLDATVAPNTQLPGYGIVNLRYDWSAIDGSGFGLAAYAKNVTDKAYYVGGLAQGAGLGYNLANPGQPRTFGAEVTYRF
jgi:iron complex outermembrane receptor protein